VTFDPRYDYDYDVESKTLTIKEGKKRLPWKFFGEGISSVIGVVGNNGTGKSTVMRYILDAVVEGSAHDGVNGIIVYERSSEIYIYKVSAGEIKIKCDVTPALTIRDNAECPVINTFYYSGHFNPSLDYGDPTTTELSGLYNASEGYMLRGDFERYVNTSDKYLNFPIASYLVNHGAQSNYRICRLLIDNRVRDLLEEYVMPRYIHIVPNTGGMNHIKFHSVAADIKEKLGKNIDLPPIISASKEEYVNYFIHTNLLNAVSDNTAMNGQEHVINRWCEIVDTKDDVLRQFKNFANKQDKVVKPVLYSIHKIITAIVASAHYNEKIGSFYFDTVNDVDAVDSLINDVTSYDLYLTSRFFDMRYSHSEDCSSMTLSSGEQVFLDLFSRIYDAVEIRPAKFSNIGKPTLLLLDEAEIGFHPEWQRKYVKMLLDFLKAIAVISSDDYQIVITSHSPILLSDIPSCCCNFLKKEKEGTINKRGELGETFASNVFDQYRNSFFLEKGLIGCFAMDWLDNLNKRVKDGGRVSHDELELIGDERLKDYFSSYLTDEDLRAYYRKKLEELDKQGHEQN
jgi:hypothetical protein